MNENLRESYYEITGRKKLLHKRDVFAMSGEM